LLPVFYDSILFSPRIMPPYTVTNSYKRGLMMKTYARSIRRAWDGVDAPVAKKICVEKAKAVEEAEDHLERAIRASSVAASSSPSRRNSTIFSSDAHDNDTVTPPSSPPPPRITPPAANDRKPTFSFLKRKHGVTRDDSEPLAEVSCNSMNATMPPNKKPRLVQMQLDLGAETRKTCATCGMEYVPSNAEDATLHRMFHDMNEGGVELSKAFMRSPAMRWAWTVSNIPGSVVVIDRKSSPPARNMAKKVLEVVNKELSAAEIDESLLWSQKSLLKNAETSGREVKQSDAEERNDHKSDRYKLFMHVKDDKCIGMCLAERITEGRRVKGADGEKNGDPNATPRPKSSSISVEEEAAPAVVGVSRIWTSKAFRRKGIAVNLLDCVMSHFIYGMGIEKEEIAFSQPTESGKQLAEEWYGEESGWLVYNEA